MAKKAKTTEAAAAAEDTIVFDDATIVERCRNGDMQAFGSLVAKYQDRVFNTMYRMCGRRADAEELAQEAFLRALEKLGQFRSQSGFYTWLFRIAVNLAISHCRHRQRIRFDSISGSEEFVPARLKMAMAASKHNPGPDAAAITAETNEMVVQALEQLEDDYRLVVVLRDVEGMDYRQIADATGLAMGTVKSRIHRGRIMLRELLTDVI